MPSIKEIKNRKRIRRIRSKISGTAVRPRLAIFKSLNHIYAQLIDDQKSETVVAASDFELKESKTAKRTDLAFKLGDIIAQKAGHKKIKEIIFDKRGYKYHGIVKALADGARKGGLKF